MVKYGENDCRNCTNVVFSPRKNGEIREHVATLVENHEEIFETVDGNLFRETWQKKSFETTVVVDI